MLGAKAPGRLMHVLRSSLLACGASCRVKIVQRIIFWMLTVHFFPPAQLEFHPVLANSQHQCKMG
jgi:hypothetical protein